MNFNQYMTAVKNQLSQMSDAKKTHWICEQARKVEEEARQEFLDSLTGKKSLDMGLSEKEIYSWCDKVERGEIYFSAEIYEDFEEGAWESELKAEYEDRFNMMPYLEQVSDIGHLWCGQGEYEKAYRLFERIGRLKFSIVCVENDYMLKEDPCYPDNLLTLVSLKREGLLPINLDELSLNLLYSCYHAVAGKERLEAMYEYFTWEMCQKLVMTDVFAFREDMGESHRELMQEWRSFLMEIPGDRSGELLVDACVFLGADKLLLTTARERAKMHPFLYQACCERAYFARRYENCTEIAKEAARCLDENKIIRGTIADIGAKAAKKAGDEPAYEELCLAAFCSEPNSYHLLRLYTLPDAGVIQKAGERLEVVSTDLPEDRACFREQETTLLYEKEQKLIFEFLLGNYQPALQYCKEEENYLGWSYGLKGMVIPLLLLYLKQDSAPETWTRAERNIRESLKYRLRFESQKEGEFEQYLAAWRSAYPVSLEVKEEWLKWLEEEVAQRTEAIVESVRLKSYYKAAELIVMLGLVKEEHGEPDGLKRLMEYYQNIYSKRRGLKQEMEKMAGRW